MPVTNELLETTVCPLSAKKSRKSWLICALLRGDLFDMAYPESNENRRNAPQPLILDHFTRLFRHFLQNFRNVLPLIDPGCGIGGLGVEAAPKQEIHRLAGLKRIGLDFP